MCDAKNKAIRVVSLTGDAPVLSQNGDTDGSNRRLNEPAEPLLRNGEPYIFNFDVPQKGTANTKFDAPHGVSVLE